MLSWSNKLHAKYKCRVLTTAVHTTHGYFTTVCPVMFHFLFRTCILLLLMIIVNLNTSQEAYISAISWLLVFLYYSCYLLLKIKLLPLLPNGLWCSTSKDYFKKLEKNTPFGEVALSFVAFNTSPCINYSAMLTSPPLTLFINQALKLDWIGCTHTQFDFWNKTVKVMMQKCWEIQPTSSP